MKGSNETESWSAFRRFLCAVAGTAGQAAVKVDTNYLTVVFKKKDKKNQVWWKSGIQNLPRDPPSVLWKDLLAITGNSGSGHYILHGDTALLNAIAVCTVLEHDEGDVVIQTATEAEFDDVAQIHGKSVRGADGNWHYDECLAPTTVTVDRDEKKRARNEEQVEVEPSTVSKKRAASSGSISGKHTPENDSARERLSLSSDSSSKRSDRKRSADAC